MPKFTTPYDTLLRVRRIEEDRAKAEMAGAAVAEREAAAVLARRENDYPELVRPPDAETTYDEFRAHHRMAEAAAASVTQARQAVESAHEQTESAREALRAAAMRTQGLERLVDRAREERFAEMLDADQRTAEESASRKRKGRR
ncbi:flagellar FliJ family protein [Mobilicoccus massiliensis]|uniref:flagellar FliJ family protein n=1 Tax=Mobilicoccus massiliensis TaxID=1522310 RepID=UPI00058FEE0E|nr:flagellar FliJ family protein [Mobilicoccus massiliensis]